MTPDEEALLGALTPAAAPITSKLDTVAWFDSTHVAVERSPVDEFVENLYGINRLYLQAEGRGDYIPILGSLVYLGMVSAAESYFRSLLRRLIITDPVCQSKASSRPVTYGAALHHEVNLLPEALFEGVSMASTKNVASELKDLCGVTQMTKEGGVPTHLQLLFENFESICQIRHCGIHRFGKLGSQQALRLGIGAHSPLLEKPLKLSVIHLQDVAEALEALIRGVNSYCFFDIIKRTHKAGPGGREKVQTYSEPWQMDFAGDRERFNRYYAIFAASDGPLKSEPVEVVYSAFMAFVKQYDASTSGSRGR